LRRRARQSADQVQHVRITLDCRIEQFERVRAPGEPLLAPGTEQRQSAQIEVIGGQLFVARPADRLISADRKAGSMTPATLNAI